MRNKYCSGNGYFKLMGCLTVLLNVIGVVFYVIFMVRTYVNGTDWLVGILLAFGALAMVTILPGIGSVFFALGWPCEKNHYEDMAD